MAMPFVRATAAALILAVQSSVAQSSAAQAVPNNNLVPKERLVLAHARNNMASALRGMPNYTCLETIERSKRPGKKRKYELIDVLRIEVGYLNGKELFAWPGSNKFDDREISDMVPSGGAIGNGNFASHSQAVFRGNVANMRFAAEDGALYRYDYEVPQNLSGYTLRSGKGAEAIVGYHGSFWVDPATKRVTRITVIADEIPALLDIAETMSSIDYSEVAIAGQAYWLPVGSSMSIADHKGVEFRNEVTFSGCRQFGGESVLRFDDPDTVAQAASAVPTVATEVVLPKEKLFAIDLTQRLRWGSNKTGDLIEAKLVSDFKYKDAVLLPKGAKVTGRITRLQQGSAFQAMDLEFDSIEGGGRKAAFRAVVTMQGSPGAVAPRGAPGIRIGRNTTLVPGPKPGTFTVVAYSQTVELSKGFRIGWATVE